MRVCDVMKDLKSDRVKKVILDTDAYNEVDDQFAIAWAILENGKKINLHSINAAPFLNSNSVSAEDGMIKSYDEIFKLVKLIDESGYNIPIKASTVPVFKGSTRFMTPDKEPVISDAAENIVKTVSESLCDQNEARNRQQYGRYLARRTRMGLEDNRRVQYASGRSFGAGRV